jgi:hypothetical protein
MTMPDDSEASERRLETLSLTDLVETMCQREGDSGEVDVERQALRMRLQVAHSESLREDVEYLRFCLEKIAAFLTLVSRDLYENGSLEPEKWFLPIPVDNPDSGELELRVRPLRLFPAQSREDLRAALEKFTDFSRFDRQEKNESSLNFAARVNMLKALTVFLDEMAGQPAAAADGLTVDYPKAAQLLQKSELLLDVAEQEDARSMTGDCGIAQYPAAASKEKLQPLRESLQRFIEEKIGQPRNGKGASTD